MPADCRAIEHRSRSSRLCAALLLADDVVPFQTSVELAEELIRQHKDFDFAFSPTATHAWASREADALYLYGKLIAHFDRWLGP